MTEEVEMCALCGNPGPLYTIASIATHLKVKVCKDVAGCQDRIWKEMLKEEAESGK